jgi:hypothetical protein
MSFLVDDVLLRRLATINSFPVRDDEMVFFGLRGALPVSPDDCEFDAAHALNAENTDYLHPRCTLGQWLPAEGLVAVFPGSTVPHSRHVRDALARGGVGVNELLTGYYGDYRKGVHKRGSATAHEAFLQKDGRPIRRTADDLDFEADDRIEVTNPFDNLHAGWCQGVGHGDYASMGCQVIVGFPQCAKLGNRPDTGPWGKFKRSAYQVEQQSFGYMLLDGRSAQGVAEAGDAELPRRVRFGSQGVPVERLQARLKEDGFYEGKVDGDFGPRTIRAVLAFQKSRFGFNSEDGVVGPQTAEALGIDLGKA